MKRIGPKMQMCADYVTQNPGCVMRRAAHYVSPSPTPNRCESYGYNTVHRALRAGLVVLQAGLLYPIDAAGAEA